MVPVSFWCRQGVIIRVSRPRTAVSMMNWPLADRSVVEERPHEPVDRVAPKILRHRQHLAAPLRRGDDAVATADGQGQRFFTEGVQTQVEQSAGHEMMRPGIGRAGGRLQPVGLPHHCRQIGENCRPAAKEQPRLVGQILAHCAH